MKDIRARTLRGQGQIQSLVWGGDDLLLDWVAGGIGYRLDGSLVRSGVHFAYAFDRALATRDGSRALIHQRLGTKGLVIRAGEQLREIDRSHYYAHTFEFPAAVFELPDGRPALVHCPQAYNQLEIDEFDSGRRLTHRHGAPEDFFHSRLQVSPDGRYLLSAGWVWQPLDDVRVVDIEDALRSPASLNGYGVFPPHFLGREIRNAALGQGILVVESAWPDGSDDSVTDSGGSAPESLLGSTSGADVGWRKTSGSEGLGPGQIAVIDLERRELVSAADLEERAGTLMPIGAGLCFGFYRYPKLIDLQSGRVLQRWPELTSGVQMSSVLEGTAVPPVLALDPLHARFALAEGDKIHVVSCQDPGRARSTISRDEVLPPIGMLERP